MPFYFILNCTCFLIIFFCKPEYLVIQYDKHPEHDRLENVVDCTFFTEKSIFVYFSVIFGMNSIVTIIILFLLIRR